MPYLDLGHRRPDPVPAQASHPAPSARQAPSAKQSPAHSAKAGPGAQREEARLRRMRASRSPNGSGARGDPVRVEDTVDLADRRHQMAEMLRVGHLEGEPA